MQNCRMQQGTSGEVRSFPETLEGDSLCGHRNSNSESPSRSDTLSAPPLEAAQSFVGHDRHLQWGAVINNKVASRFPIAQKIMARLVSTPPVPSRICLRSVLLQKPLNHGCRARRLPSRLRPKYFLVSGCRRCCQSCASWRARSVGEGRGGAERSEVDVSPCDHARARHPAVS